MTIYKPKGTRLYAGSKPLIKLKLFFHHANLICYKCQQEKEESKMPRARCVLYEKLL